MAKPIRRCCPKQNTPLQLWVADKTEHHHVRDGHHIEKELRVDSTPSGNDIHKWLHWWDRVCFGTHCADTMEIRQQGQLRSNAAYLGRRNQHLTTIAQRQTRGRTDARRILLGGTPVLSGSTLHSTERAITQLPGICVNATTATKAAEWITFFFGSHQWHESKFTWTNFR